MTAVSVDVVDLPDLMDRNGPHCQCRRPHQCTQQASYLRKRRCDGKEQFWCSGIFRLFRVISHRTRCALCGALASDDFVVRPI